MLLRTLALTAVTALIALAVVPAQARQPNILHIHADDHRADGLHALGNPTVKTPNLDTLVARGTTFTHCYTQGSMMGAVCKPSRTMMLSGHSWLRLPDDKPKATAPDSLPAVLGRAGYATLHVGKPGNSYSAAHRAFDTDIAMPDETPDLRRGSSERHADATIKYLTERDVSKPFYIYFAPPVPHDPRVAAPEFHGMYKAADMPLSPAFMPQHPWDNGEMTVRDEQLAPWPRTPQDTQQQLADYYACITGLDHHVGRIFEQLKASGEWANTLIVFTGDNGLSMGEHGLFGKQNLYEFGGMHVPCVIAGPGIPAGRSDALVYLMDLFPTFVELAGAALPAGVESHSLLPILQGKKAGVREVLYTGYRNAQRAVRDARWKLIRYPLVDKTQLFDLRTDTLELSNLADKPEHATKVAEMMTLLANEQKLYGDTAPLIVPNPMPAAWTPPTAEQLKAMVPKQRQGKQGKAK
jgi:arylsulfatase A-like enzyme